MGTIVKALKLLDHFSSALPEIGLTQFVRLSGYDKATTHRRLSELLEAGFIEQDPVTRSYRLGVALLRLSNVREQTFPAHKAVMPILQKLATATQETVHVSLLQGHTGLSTFAYVDDKTQAISVNFDPAEILPLHATASGLVVLAFSEPALLQRVIDNPLETFTADTVTDADALRTLVEQTRKNGFGLSPGGFDAGVSGTARPLFDIHGQCNGAVAIVAPELRLTEQLDRLIRDILPAAAHEITLALGGIEPVGVFDNAQETATGDLENMRGAA